MKSIKLIEDFLLGELDRTRRSYDQARREFIALTSEIPSGIPHPDGTARITNAGRKNAATLKDYMRALREFNDFALNGKVPDRIKGFE